jgi:hypothetical protein
MKTKNFKPILFNTEMVQAILAGRKTETRRLKGLKVINANRENYHHNQFSKDNQFFTFEKKDTRSYELIKVPYQVGDVLWVKETFSNELWTQDVNFYQEIDTVYKADDYATKMEVFEVNSHFLKWKPSIFMGKESCRLFLEVVNVKCEPICYMEANDAINEGIVVEPFEQPYIKFSKLWNSIHKEPQHNFFNNPYVWVVQFKVIDKPEDFLSHE